MSATTGIEWTDATWNPVTGCTKVSSGCDHCYAESLHNRFHGPGAFDTLTLHPDRLPIPLSWRKPRKVFVNSMSDLFHADVPDEFIAAVWATMFWTSPEGRPRYWKPRHTYQILTKRHARMRAWVRQWIERDQRVAWIEAAAERGWCDHHDVAEAPWMNPVLPNVWLGVSVETQQWADIRIPALLDTPAAVRFLSCEPLLGPLNLSRWLGVEFYDSFGWGEEMCASLAGRVGPAAGLHWVIAGASPVRKHAPWTRRGCGTCVTSAPPPKFRSCSSNGAPGRLPGLGSGRSRHQKSSSASPSTTWATGRSCAGSARRTRAANWTAAPGTRTPTPPRRRRPSDERHSP